MPAQILAPWLQRRGIHYGWIVAAITFCTMLVMAAAIGLPGAMLLALGQEFGWTTEQIASSLALRFALFGLLGPFAALFMERFGLRPVICTGLVLVGGSMALATRASELWHLFVLWGVLLGFGTGLTALVLGAVVANRWFVARRGLVLGLLTASSATGQLAFLPLAAWIITHWGWRAAVLPVVLACAVILVLALVLMRDRPGDVGLAAYGETAPAASPGQTPALTLMTPLLVLWDGLRHPVFWILAASFFICGLSTNGLVQTHFIALCSDFGLEPIPAASVLALMGAFDFVGTILSGWLSDRYDNRKLLFWYYGLRGLSLMWLPYSDFTLYGLSLFALFYGLDWIATVPPTVKLTAATFGAQRVGMMFGWIFAAHQLGAAVAAYGAGYIRTSMQTYTPAFFAAGLACLVAAVIVLAIRQRRTAVA